jgi:DNA repair protein RadC
MSDSPKTKKPERLFQKRFDEHFAPLKVQEVTPAGFKGLGAYPRREEALVPAAPNHELGRFVQEVREEVVIDSPQVAAKYLLEKVFAPFEQFDQEEIHVLLLNNKNRITHVVMVYRGTVNQALIRSSELFKEAVRANAVSIILAHNHPSGDPTPSPQDAQVTGVANEVARLLDINLLDHIIVGQDRWVSLKEYLGGKFGISNRKEG